MTAIHIKAFRGQVPRISDRLLQGNQATRAMNCKITSGRLDPLNGLGLVYTNTGIVGDIKTVYRYRHMIDGAAYDNWMTWASDVDVVPSPLSNDELGRVYFTSEDFEPRMATYAQAIAGTSYPNAWYQLGVFAPTAAPSLSASGGTAPVEARTYLYTFVTALGEESGPSPASTVVSGNINGTWSLTGLQTAPSNSGTVSAATTISGGRVRVTLNTVFGLELHDMIGFSGVVGMTDLNSTFRIVAIDTVNSRVEVSLQTAQTYTSGGSWSKSAPHNTTGMKKRIYRSAGTVADFQFVAEIDAATTSYNDAVATADLGESIPTFESLTPPKNMKCLTSLPNGCLVGISDNQVCLSDPYKPYSWPDANRYSFSGRGVALCPSGNSVIVLTDTFPVILVGSDPAAMTPSTMETYAPCVSKRGTVNIGGGALYPSFDGLWLAAPGTVQKITKNLYRVEEWSALQPETFVAAYRDSKYYANRGSGQSGMIFILDVPEPDSIVEVDEWCTGLSRSEYDGNLYIAQGNKVYRWDAIPATAYSSDWISAQFQLGAPTNFSVAQVHAQFNNILPINTEQIDANLALMANADDVTGDLNANSVLEVEINGSFIVPVAQETPKRVQFTLYADEDAVFSREVSSSKPFRLPSGFRSEIYNIGLNASVPTYSVTIAESMDELSKASV